MFEVGRIVPGLINWRKVLMALILKLGATAVFRPISVNQAEVKLRWISRNIAGDKKNAFKSSENLSW